MSIDLERWRRPVHLMILLVLINGTLQILADDRIPINDGFGEDGLLYGHLAIDFEGTIRAGIDSERAQRILPSALVHLVLIATGIPRTPRNAFTIFSVWNLAALVASVVCWDRIAATLRLGPTGRWLGFLGLFTNFGSAKWPFYYAPMTDTTALLLGLLMVRAYLRGSLAGLVAVMSVAAFTWSSFGYFCLLLIAFPRPVGLQQGQGGAARDLAALAAALAYAAGAYYWYYFIYGDVPILPPSYLRGAEALKKLLRPHLGIITGGAYLFFTLRPLVDLPLARFVQGLRTALSVRGLALGLLVLTATRVVARLLSSTPGISLGGMLLHIVIEANRPLLFLVGHVVYFGPIVLLMGFYWRRIARTVLGHGAGAMLFILAAICISPRSESRHLIHVYPFLVAMTAQALDEVRFTRSFYAFFVAASIAFSKVWLPLDHGPGLPQAGREFPWQWYAMHIGLWMSKTMYFVQGTAAVATAIGLWWLLPRAPSDTPLQAVGGETRKDPHSVISLEPIQYS